jgi:hypothetical protein
LPHTTKSGFKSRDEKTAALAAGRKVSHYKTALLQQTGRERVQSSPRLPDRLMRNFSSLVLHCCGWLLAGSLAWTQGGASPAPLILVGGTVVDVTAWGKSAHDLRNAAVVIHEGRIIEVAPLSTVNIPKGARVVDCSGKFLIPGLVDGYTGMSSQGQASASLAMGITTVVARNDRAHGRVDLAAHPSPHLYLIDSVGVTDDWSLLAAHNGQWAERLRAAGRQTELPPQETARQITDINRMGTRALFLGPHLTAANSQAIISRAHQLGMVTYGEFVATPYQVGIEAGVDALPQMGHYELGAIPKELQRPLVEDPEGAPATTAFDYAGRVPPIDVHLRNYAHFLATHHAALMPTFSTRYVNLPDHRNLWKEPAAALLNPAQLFDPSNPTTGEMDYTIPSWAQHLPASGQRWIEENLRHKADQHAWRLWRINGTIFAAFPHYLAASGAPLHGSMPGISLHTELELLVRLGLSPREALAAATNNYALEFGWNELGLITPGRRADILVVDADPTANIWNARRIHLLLIDGNFIDREALLHSHR